MCEALCEGQQACPELAEGNDANDAEAICEAAGRPAMRFAAPKTVARQDWQAAHRMRSELIRRRTAKADQIRRLLAEYGLVAGKRVDALAKRRLTGPKPDRIRH